MKRIIAISGKAGSGKDEFGKVLINDYGYVKFSFADAFKEAMCLFFGWSRADLEKQEFKSKVDPFWGFTPRHAMILFGSDIMKKEFPRRLEKLSKKKLPELRNIWANVLARKIEKSQYNNIVITDMRFPEEMEILEKLSFKNGYIFSPIRIEVGYKKMPTSVSKNPVKRFFQLLLKPQHISEYALDNNEEFMVTIYNDSTKEIYIRNIKHWCTMNEYRIGHMVENHVPSSLRSDASQEVKDVINSHNRNLSRKNRGMKQTNENLDLFEKKISQNVMKSFRSQN